jgi:hypothetical protein
MEYREKDGGMLFDIKAEIRISNIGFRLRRRIFSLGPISPGILEPFVLFDVMLSEPGNINYKPIV